MLTKEIADEIVKETMRRLKRNINIIDISGTIIASGDSKRINLFHEGGLHVVKTGIPLIITEQNKDYWKGCKLGINLPIEFQNNIIGAIGISGAIEDVEEFGDLVKMTTELMIKQSFIATKSEWHQRTKEETFEEIIKQNPNFDTVNQRLELLNINLFAPFNLFLIDIKAVNFQSQLLIRKIEETFNKNQTLTGFIKLNQMFILASGIPSDTALKKITYIIEVLKQLQVPCKIGYSTIVNELKMIKISYREAQIVLKLKEKQPLSILNKYADRELEGLIYQVDKEITTNYLNRTFPNIAPHLIETLQTFFDFNLSITETAKHLFVHRNTLIYRIKKVKEVTGLDPQNFTDAVKLQIAIWVYENGTLEE